MRFDAMRGRARWLFMREVVARPERPSRWTLPITALRVTLPSRPAIWLALRPSPQSFFSSSTRSSVQAIKFRSLSIRGARKLSAHRLTIGTDSGRRAERCEHATTNATSQSLAGYGTLYWGDANCMTLDERRIFDRASNLRLRACATQRRNSISTRDLVPRQDQTYNRQNWAYKIRLSGDRGSNGTGGIFATCNSRARCFFARRC